MASQDRIVQSRVARCGRVRTGKTGTGTSVHCEELLRGEGVGVGTEEPVLVFAEWAGEGQRGHFAESTVAQADPGGINVV